MPSRNNPNLPKSLNRRVISHKRKAQARRQPVSSTPSDPRGEPTDPRASISGSGVLRGRTVSSKKARKAERNRENLIAYVKQRAAAELLVKEGEVEMADVQSGLLSKRQKKLMERRAKAEEHNAALRTAKELGDDMDADKTFPSEVAVDTGEDMEVDI